MANNHVSDSLQMKSVLVHIVSCFILNNSSQARRMLPTTTQEDTTQLERSLSIKLLIELGNLQTSAPVFKGSSSSTALVVVLDLVSPPS